MFQKYIFQKYIFQKYIFQKYIFQKCIFLNSHAGQGEIQNITGYCDAHNNVIII